MLSWLWLMALEALGGLLVSHDAEQGPRQQTYRLDTPDLAQRQSVAHVVIIVGRVISIIRVGNALSERDNG